MLIKVLHFEFNHITLTDGVNLEGYFAIQVVSRQFRLVDGVVGVLCVRLPLDFTNRSIDGDGCGAAVGASEGAADEVDGVGAGLVKGNALIRLSVSCLIRYQRRRRLNRVCDRDVLNKLSHLTYTL